MPKILFWQNMPTMYQASIISRFSELWSGDVVVITDHDLSKERTEQGWYSPDYSPASLIVNPTMEKRKDIIESQRHGSDLNLISGIHASKVRYRLFRNLLNRDARVGVYVEPGRVDDGFTVYLRKLRYRYHAHRWGEDIDLLLTTGHLGEQYYRSCGFPEQSIVPFGYFPESNAAPVSNFVDSKRPSNLIFVGTLTRRKGVDVLLRSLSNLDPDRWTLTMVGEGELGESLKRTARNLGIDHAIGWEGNLPNKVVHERLSNADALVLPSRYDGWGVVVNEALLAGTPVVTTEACGAEDLIQHPELGEVVPPADVGALTSAIEERLSNSPPPRDAIRAWAERAISPEAAAKYLVKVLDGLETDRQPDPPWRVTDFPN